MTLTWVDNGITPTSPPLFMAYSRRHYVGFTSLREDGLWEWGFRDAGTWRQGKTKRKHDSMRRVTAHWQSFCVEAGLVSNA